MSSPQSEYDTVKANFLKATKRILQNRELRSNPVTLNNYEIDLIAECNNYIDFIHREYRGLNTESQTRLKDQT